MLKSTFMLIFLFLIFPGSLLKNDNHLNANSSGKAFGLMKNNKNSYEETKTIGSNHNRYGGGGYGGSSI